MTVPSNRASGPVTPHRPTWRQRVGAWCVFAAVQAVASTRPFRVRAPDGILAATGPSPVIFATWHNRLAFSLVTYRRLFRSAAPDRRMAALVSASRDGAFLAAVLTAFGVQPVRGSSSRRGPQALLEMTSWARQGFDLAITPDGPRGPCYRVQTGAVALARVTGLPIVPIVCNTRWRLDARSWDRFQMPLPFGPCEIAVAPLLRVTAADPAGLESARQDLEARLLSVTRD